MDAVTDRVIRGEGTSEQDWLAWPGLSLLRSVTPQELVPDNARAVVVAPHPDDEVLSVGGLLALLARGFASVSIVAVTDGTASHQGSSVWTRARLANERPQESRAALRHLGVHVDPVRLGLPDGGLQDMRCELAERLLSLLQPGDVVFTTWRMDGHPDHEATGHACAFAAARVGARLVEVPVWAWHWATPGDPRMPWRRAVRLPFGADIVARKRMALLAHQSQLLPDSTTGAGPVLRGDMVARAERPFEIMWT